MIRRLDDGFREIKSTIDGLKISQVISFGVVTHMISRIFNIVFEQVAVVAVASSTSSLVSSLTISI